MTCPRCERIVVAFELATRPQPKRRPRFGNGHAYTDAKTVAYENALGLACRAAMKTRSPATGDVVLACLFEQKDGRASDTDNLAKACSDAIQGIAFVNDRQVVEIRARRVLRAGTDRVSVAVLEVPA